MRNINVFVSSLMQELECEREIAQKTILDMNLNPILFELFPALNQSPATAYIDQVKKSDIFILMLWKHISQPVIDEYVEAIKRNKPIIVLVKHLAENEEREQKLKEFINEIKTGSTINTIRMTVYKGFRTVSEFKEALQDSINFEIRKLYEEPIYTISKEEMYELGTRIISNTQKRIYIFQKTPSLFLGARPYLSTDDKKYFYEKEFFEKLKEWIQNNSNSPDKELLYLFSLNDTKKELKNSGLCNERSYVERCNSRINNYLALENNSNFRFRFSMIDTAISGPLIIGDNQYAIWLLGEDDAVSISQENEQICSILCRILKSHSQKKYSSEEIIKSLGL